MKRASERIAMSEMQQGPWDEYRAWLQGAKTGEYYEHLLHEATTAPERNALRDKVIKPSDQLWENAPHGLIKHLVNEEMGTRAETVDAYMLVIPPGSKSGKIRQLAEQAVYIVEGRGYDIHVDCDLEIVDGEKYSWIPQTESQRFDWEAGDTVYLPPNTINQHFNADPERIARIIIVTNRIYKMSGLNDLEQLENAPEYTPGEKLTAERLRHYLHAKARA
jgi:uncharacterized RmlC-like cupin family protein